jgi:hypothetical protein
LQIKWNLLPKLFIFVEFKNYREKKSAIQRFMQAPPAHARTGIASIATGQGRPGAKVE